MASIDVDRDGRTDVAVTHLYDPVSLLINQTEQGGRSINLELKATATARDAIGAIVTMKVGDQQVTTQLTAGDGYMCSNQRRISVGLVRPPRPAMLLSPGRRGPASRSVHSGPVKIIC